MKSFNKPFLDTDHSTQDTDHSEETINALNQFSVYSKTTPVVYLDLRCEFDVPRFADLKSISDPQEETNFNWFLTPHDFFVPASKKVETLLRTKILNLGKRPVPPPKVRVPSALKFKLQKKGGQINSCRNLQQTPLNQLSEIKKKINISVTDLDTNQRKLQALICASKVKRQHSATTPIVVSALGQHKERARTLSKDSFQSNSSLKVTLPPLRGPKPGSAVIKTLSSTTRLKHSFKQTMTIDEKDKENQKKVLKKVALPPSLIQAKSARTASVSKRFI